MSVEIKVFVLCMLLKLIWGHGRMMEPPNRSSLWRIDPTAVPNYDDDQNFCGGAYTQWEVNGGKCGVCGDSFDSPHPQSNENTGTYGQGKVVRQYRTGSVINITIEITANHLGGFNFSLCKLEHPYAEPEPGEGCFRPVSLVDGSPWYYVNSDDTTVNLQLQLPDGEVCERCVLRWNYRCGNNWGYCDDGTSGLGCGPQEHFRSCADVAIY